MIADLCYVFHRLGLSTVELCEQLLFFALEQVVHMVYDFLKVLQIVVMLPFETTKAVIFTLDLVDYLLVHGVNKAFDVLQVPLNV